MIRAILSGYSPYLQHDHRRDERVTHRPRPDLRATVLDDGLIGRNPEAIRAIVLEGVVRWRVVRWRVVRVCCMDLATARAAAVSPRPKRLTRQRATPTRALLCGHVGRGSASQSERGYGATCTKAMKAFIQPAVGLNGTLPLSSGRSAPGPPTPQPMPPPTVNHMRVIVRTREQ